jgi:hypothetical protein
MDLEGKTSAINQLLKKVHQTFHIELQGHISAIHGLNGHPECQILAINQRLKQVHLTNPTDPKHGISLELGITTLYKMVPISTTHSLLIQTYMLS